MLALHAEVWHNNYDLACLIMRKNINYSTFKKKSIDFD